jgi:Protein of unknown function (DUF2914)/Helix-turn-helix domain
METFGQKMSQAVASRGVKLEEVARATRVELRELEALINGEYTALPDEDRVTDLLRSFAQYVEVDGDAVIRDYMLDRHGTVPPELSSRHRRSWPIVLAVTVAAVLAAWWWFRWPEPAERAARVAPAPVQTASVQPAPAPPPPPVEVEERTELGREPVAVVPGRWVVEEFGVGTGVVARAVVGQSDHFDEGTEVWFLTRITGAEPGDTIHHVWLHDGQVANDVALRVGGSPWRTQSKKLLHAGSAGSWAVEARDDSGHVLARREFSCAPYGSR